MGNVSVCGLQVLGEPKPLQPECTLGRPPFHHASGSLVKLCCGAAESSPTGPIRFPQVPFPYPRSRTATVEPGRVLPHTWPLRRFDCTLSRLFALVAEEYDRPVARSVATPEPGCPGPHPRSSRSLLRP